MVPKAECLVLAHSELKRTNQPDAFELRHPNSRRWSATIFPGTWCSLSTMATLERRYDVSMRRHYRNARLRWREASVGHCRRRQRSADFATIGLAKYRMQIAFWLRWGRIVWCGDSETA